MKRWKKLLINMWILWIIGGIAVKVGLLQFNVRAGRRKMNVETVERFLDEAIQKRPDVILFPELWTSGYDLPNLSSLSDIEGEPVGGLLRSWATDTGAVVIGGSTPVPKEDRYANTMYAVNPGGELILTYEKAHLFGLMDEDKFMIPGNRPGNFMIGGIPCGAIICYDLRFPEWVRKTVLSGCQLLFVAAQWPAARLNHWRILSQARAVENQCFVIACNRTGRDENGTEFPGHSLVADPWGRIIGEADDREGWLWVDIDPALVSDVRESIPVFQDRRADLY